jgi:hypothetical protein
MDKPSLQYIIDISREIINRVPVEKRGIHITEDRRFLELFGCGPLVALALWTLISENHLIPPKVIVRHMLWGLFFLKTYTTKTLLCQMSSVKDKKTFRKWSWKFFEVISMLEPIIVSNMVCVNIACFVLTFYDLSHCIIVHFPIYLDPMGIFLKGHQWNDCLITVDGTDYRSPTQGKRFFNFKFRGFGLHYKIGISIMGSDIVWLNGPYESGTWNDIKIFRDSLMSNLDPGERVEADDGYVGETLRHVKCPMSFANPLKNRWMQGIVRSRYDTINKRFTQWGCFIQRFQHDYLKDAGVLRSCVVITGN